MQVNSEDEMINFGRLLASSLTLPCAIELRGDVGVGKTTFTRGFAAGLGITEPITSPSFTISKRYQFAQGGELVHYDFYRLDDPGIMSMELADTLSQPNTVTVVEWAGDVQNILPENTIRLDFTLREDDSRFISTNSPLVENLWKTQKKLCKTCGKSQETCVKSPRTCVKLSKTSKNPQKSPKVPEKETKND